MKYIIENIIVPINKNQNKEIKEQIIRRNINYENIDSISYLKRAIDSRNRKNIKFVYNLLIETDKKYNLKEPKPDIKMKNKKKVGLKEIYIIGSGPAGLFAALRCAEIGLKPIIFEQGEDVDSRDISIERFFKEKKLNENSNIQFGEGGAGTYSDGKLTTRIKSGYIKKVFDELVLAGASEEIMYDYKPHIGTDILKNVIKNLRRKIINLGGEFHFSSKLNNIYINNGKITDIRINDEKIGVEKLILATGHSAREIYRILNENGVALENKNFAVGFRIEHPREIIDKMQYGRIIEKLGSAPYSFTYNDRNSGRGVYSFCMCPGGEIVNGASEIKTSLTNGMSNNRRDSNFSNSAIVVSVDKRDFGNELFGGIKFQREIEKNIYNVIGDYGSLYQNLFDYIDGNITQKKINTNYKMNLLPYDLNKIFNDNINCTIKNAFKYWSKNKYFVSNEANLFAAETRSSSPIRIIRKNNSESINIENLYVIGEGAGYAGGIVSSAVDGIKVVEMNFGE